MNCKPGDLAVIVGSKSHQMCNGMVVLVVRPAGERAWLVSGHMIEEYSRRRGLRPILNDEKLRPIRDNGKEDETLQWAGKPNEVTA